MQLTHASSPLDQVGQRNRIAQAPSRRPLSLKEQATVKQILAGGYDYIYHELFDVPEAQRQIFDEVPPIPKPDNGWYHTVFKDASAPQISKHDKTIRLRAPQERALFIQFNYCRFKVNELRSKLLEQTEIDPDWAREMLRWYRKAKDYRDQIAQTNLALVLAMANRTRMSEADFSELVSEGNMALLRAVDKFDVARGFKFSTYACRAILKAFSRSGVKLSKYRQMFPTDFDPKLEKSDHQERKRDQHEEDCVDELKHIIRKNQAELSQIEQEVIQHRFAINKPEGAPDAQPLTLEQVGKIIGVTKERVRQIQHKALGKLHAAVDERLREWSERRHPEMERAR
ncbi:MAG: sigma-70 family RNA polymerase sigma factor [bacterium]